MKKIKYTLSVILLCTGTFFTSYAIDLGSAKASGQVGEKITGYLGVVKASPDATKLVNQVNSKRKKIYKNIAGKNGTDVKNVEMLAGQKAIDKTAKGQYIDTGSGWHKKK